MQSERSLTHRPLREAKFELPLRGLVRRERHGPVVPVHEHGHVLLQPRKQVGNADDAGDPEGAG